MKFTVHKLRIGDQVWAQIVERLGPHEYIVSFFGDLVRIKTDIPAAFVVGDKVLVRATALAPLAFKLVPKSENNRKANRLNVSI